ncbi:MAG: division/cell wall cluster transcriptional repressor MraZ [Paludibacteraceae bacterium]
MSTFIGKYEAKADTKGRIFIPSVYRKLLPEGGRERVVLREDPDNDCLVIYPEPVWNKKVETLQSTLDEWNPDDQMLLIQFVADAEWLDIDSQGRILIPKKTLELISLGNNEVLFVGMMDRFTLWGKQYYEQNKLSSAQFAEKLKDKMKQSSSL